MLLANLELTLFFLFGGVAVIAAFGVVFNKNVVHSALFLLLDMVMLAGLYVLLNAEYIAVIQILVYAGAIVVLILFVIMFLGAELGERIPTWLTVRNLIVVFLAAVFLTVTGTAVFEWLGVGQAIHGNVTPQLITQNGSVEMVGAAIFTDYILPFEFASVVLLVGIVGVITLGGWRKVQHRKNSE